MGWEKQLVAPEQVIHLMRPGMRVFMGTGAAEPRSLVQHLMASRSNKLQDLELIQLASFAEAVTLGNLQAQKFRLKTFFSGWVAQEAIAAGVSFCKGNIPCKKRWAFFSSSAETCSCRILSNSW